MIKKSLFSLVLVTLFFSCKQSSTINTEEAGKVIANYLKANPEFKTTRFNFGELKFNSENDYKELEKYRVLAKDGYLTLTLLSAKKKFLSKDSSYTYSAKLAAPASDFVLKQDPDKATVKVVTYELTDEKPVDFSKVNDATAKVTVTLKKTNTPFASFQKRADENSDFLTKTYKLKFDKETGWAVAK